MLTTTEKNGIIVAKFNETNRFHALNSEPVKEELGSHFNTQNTKLVLDLGGIQFIDSTGFGVFLSLMKKAGNNYGEFKIANVSEDVMELFKLLQLHNVFEIHNSVDEAVRSFKK